MVISSFSMYHNYYTLYTHSNSLFYSHAGVNEEPGCSILFLPMFHIYGLNAVIATVLSWGHTVVLMGKFNPEEYLQLIEKYQVRYKYSFSP